VVERGDAPITELAAVARLQAGGDIVVCGPERRANRNKARELTERAFVGFEGDEVHDGRMALYHFHPLDRNPEDTHAFYDTPRRYARKRKS
jgi:hypothetical protein